MKYIVIIPDGMADLPMDELHGQTPLAKAHTPHLDLLAREGMVGRVCSIPLSFHPGSDVACLSLMGYEPQRYYRGRGPIEASSMGITLGPRDVAFRLNLVSIEKGLMHSYSSGHISTQKALPLVMALRQRFSHDGLEFLPGLSYRHLMVFRLEDEERAEALEALELTPPHDILGQPIETHLPKGPHKEAQLLLDLMKASEEVLTAHPVNIERGEKGLPLANMAWPWGQGRAPQMPPFSQLYQKKGAVIAGVDLIKGLGRLAGLEIPHVPGATGYFDTDHRAKAQWALKASETSDVVFVHLEAPDEAGHLGDVQLKIKTIEVFDQLLLGTLLEGLKERADFRLLVMPDHLTPCKFKTHIHGEVPFVIYGKGIKANKHLSFTEQQAKNSDLFFEEGPQLLKFFFSEI